MVRKAAAPSEDNERHSAGIRAAGRAIRHVNLSGINTVRFHVSWKQAAVAVADAVPAGRAIAFI
jgi:hypothetical protein